MKRRDFIVSTLVRIGFRTSLKGFDQFVQCVEFYLSDRNSAIESIYRRTAEVFGCSKSAVEKNLHRLLEGSDACSEIGKLFGIELNDASNKELIAVFSNYVLLHRDCYIDPPFMENFANKSGGYKAAAL